MGIVIKSILHPMFLNEKEIFICEKCYRHIKKIAYMNLSDLNYFIGFSICRNYNNRVLKKMEKQKSYLIKYANRTQ